jgi:hypothetical protein
MAHTYFINDEQITLINIGNGNRVTMYRDDQRFDKFKDLIIAQKYDEAEALDVKQIVQNFARGLVRITDGIGNILINGAQYPLADAITNRILKLAEDGFDSTPLVNFVQRLYNNPSKTAIDELFLFLERTELPITEDGCFIAYKIVRENYMDIYSGTFSNKVGDICSMPRFQVNDTRENTCASGLHFCSKDYLRYGSNNRNNDRCMLVKIDPADVVSIPNDYDNSKGRTCMYEVVGEVNDGSWRTSLPEKDYISSPVVNNNGGELPPSTNEVFDRFFDVDYESEVILWADTGREVYPLKFVVNKLVKYADNVLNELENNAD